MALSPNDARAAYNQGLDLITGKGSEPAATDFEFGRDLIAKASKSCPPAMAHLAALDAMHIGGKSNDKQTAKTFVSAAMSGFPPAVRGLAVILLSAPDTQAMGAGLIRRAAQGGDWVSAFLILREAQRGRALASQSELAGLAAQISTAVPFREQIAADIAKLPSALSEVALAPFSKELSEQAVISALGAILDLRKQTLCDHPGVQTFSAVLSPLEADYLIALSCAHMQPSKVVDAQDAGAISAGYRSSDGAVLLPAHMDVVIVSLARRLARAAGIEPEQGEFLSLLRYRPGQEYLPHHDFLERDAEDYSRVESCGQRKRTLLTYLNSGYEGGDTVFPDLGISFKGKAGDCLRFENVDANSRPIAASLHAGAPVTSGEKWLATLWCREKTFWPWIRKA